MQVLVNGFPKPASIWVLFFSLAQDPLCHCMFSMYHFQLGVCVIAYVKYFNVDTFFSSLIGLPTIVARNTMIDARSESVVLPLVAKNVQTPVAALNASNSEGADFLIYGSNGGTHAEEPGSSVWETVKVPIFVMIASFGFDPISVEAKNLLKSGASGLVVSLGELKVLTDEVMSKLFTTVHGSKNRGQGTYRGSDKLKTLKVDNGFPGRKKVAGFVKLEDRERQLVETEKMVLLEVISVIQGAVPLVIF